MLEVIDDLQIDKFEFCMERRMEILKYTRVEECCDILDSMRIPITASDRKEGKYPYYGANGIQDYVNDYIFDDELVLLAEDGGNFGSKEKPIAYRVSGKCWVNNHAHVLKPKEEIDVDYLCYSLMFYKVDGMINGATRKKLTQTAMKKMKIPLRNIVEQKKIVQQLNKIIEIREKAKKELNLLDNLIQARFVELFGDAVYNDKKWETDTVKNLCKEIYGGGTPSKAHPEYYKDGDIPWVSAKDMKTDVLKDSQIKINQLGVDNSTARLVPVNSVIMVIRSGILKHTLPVAVNKVPITVNQDLKVFIPGERILTRFLAVQFKMQEKDILSGVRAVTADNIEFNSLKQRRMIVPPIDLQQKYLMFLERIDKSKFVIHKFLYCTTHNTKSIIKPRPNTKESGKIRGRETTCRRILTF